MSWYEILWELSIYRIDLGHLPYQIFLTLLSASAIIGAISLIVFDKRTRCNKKELYKTFLSLSFGLGIFFIQSQILVGILIKKYIGIDLITNDFAGRELLGFFVTVFLIFLLLFSLYLLYLFLYVLYQKLKNHIGFQ